VSPVCTTTMKTIPRPQPGSASLSGENSSHSDMWTPEASPRFVQPTLFDMCSATSLLESGDGPLRSDSPDGQKIGRSGREAPHANLFHSWESRAALTMHGTSGRLGSGSLRSAALTASLVSRLTERLSGLTALPLIWRLSTTPSRRFLFRLVPCRRGKKDSGFTMLPTPRHSMGSHMIAWTRAESGDHRHNLEDFLACMWLADGGIRTKGLNVCPRLCASLMGYPESWVDSAMQSSLS
jgi:hypothetical protein